MISNKKYPLNYSKQYIQVINALSISKKPIIIGSFGKQGILYPSDIDIDDNVIVKKNTKKQLQNVIRKLQKIPFVIIGDIKAGQQNDESIRWKPHEFLNGMKGNYNLENAIIDNAIFKIDVIAYIQSVYIEFSCVYMFWKNKEHLNAYERKSLSDVANDALKDKNYFKMAKRRYSDKPSKKLLELFNSKVGGMNQIIANIKTLIYLIENNEGTKQRIQNEIDGFITRLNLFCDTNLDKDKLIIELLRNAENTNSKSKLLLDLEKLENHLNDIVQKESKEYLRKNNML